MKSPALSIALAAAVDLPSGGTAPDWVHLIPTVHGDVQTFDGRGPYHVTDAQAIIAASQADPRGLPIDENHSLYLAAPQGQSAPARGWIIGMELRPDGIWGHVEWTDAGRELVAGRAYRALSPVLMHDKAGAIQRITCASLVNRPNLKGLTTLNQETTMSFQTTLAEKLGLAAEASEDDILAAVSAKGAGESAALQSAIGEIGIALGVDAGAKPEAVIAAAKSVKATQPAEVAALQSELTALQAENVELGKKVNALTDGAARDKATAYVDAEIKRGRVGLKPMRERYISMHMANAAETEELVAALPVIGASGTLATPSAPKDGAISLNAEQLQAAKLLGIPAKDYAEELKAERGDEEDV